MTDDVAGCLACDLTAGRADLPGGRIHATEHWAVEHCIGPLGAGTLIVKPIRHCLHVWELTDDETEELGLLLRQTTETVRQLAEADQVYVCLWSFAGWQPGHIHFVLQPVWEHTQERHEHPGPCHQRDMFHANELPSRAEVEAFSKRARTMFGATQ